MRVPLSWLREFVELPAEVTGRDLAARLIEAGLEVETVEDTAAGLAGGIVVGQVLEIEELTGFKKPIRYCAVDIGTANGTGEPQHVVCGAVNFAVGDRVVVVLPGSTLPGGFEVGSRKTYGRMSHGMICSAAELGMWDDHTGILVLGPDAPEPGADAVALLGLRDEVLDIAVTPDRGYALSLRGVARDAAVLYGARFRDPADIDPARGPEGYPAEIADAAACDRFMLHEVSGFDPGAPTPLWMKHRLAMAGMRPISLAVDVTNYVMWELGQPLHAFDRTKLTGGVVVRRARAGERLETLDHVTRDLDPDDTVITDASGPIAMAGAMGGARTEIDETSTELVLEAAHFSPTGTARMGRRHKLSSEASRRFERGVDRELPPVALARAAELLVRYGGGTRGGLTRADAEVSPPRPVVVREDHASAVAGVAYPSGTAARRLRELGCAVEEDGAELRVTPPSWRPDLSDPNDLAEEVIRLEGYENIPSVAPRAPAGRGLASSQRLTRLLGRTLAGRGLTEVLCYPFVGERDFDALQLEGGDPRRRAVRLANPLSEDEPLLRTTLLPGLLKTLARNVSRGFGDAALFEIGAVYLPDPHAPGVAPLLPVHRGPTEREVASVEEALPRQPRRVGAVMSGQAAPSGWWGAGRPQSWADAVEAARAVADAAHAVVEVRAQEHLPWHPGRCAALYAVGPGGEERLVGHAGELHPRVVRAYGLPERAVAMELDLELVALTRRPVAPPRISAYPVAMQDVALVVDAQVPAAEVESALRGGAGDLLEDVTLFDVYTGEQVEPGRKSLAYTLRFRAEDRTLTGDEATRARDAAVTAAAERTGAVLRG